MRFFFTSGITSTLVTATPEGWLVAHYSNRVCVHAINVVDRDHVTPPDMFARPDEEEQKQ